MLHTFGTSSTDGFYATSNLARDSSGNLYGATEQGGAHSAGTVFEVTATGAESLPYSFYGYLLDAGYLLGGGLLRDTSGNLYGVTLERSSS